MVAFMRLSDDLWCLTIVDMGAEGTGREVCTLEGVSTGERGRASEEAVDDHFLIEILSASITLLTSLYISLPSSPTPPTHSLDTPTRPPLDRHPARPHKTYDTYIRKPK